MEVFEAETDDEEFNIPVKRKPKPKKKKSTQTKFVSLSKHVPIPSDIKSMDLDNYKMWKRKLNKFRTTSWVVRVCTDFALPIPLSSIK